MFETFKALHHAPTPLVLYNAWDAGSAQAITAAGAPAIATGSWSVAAAQGYEDGEAFPFEALVQTTQRIQSVISVPLSIDMEAGYSDIPDEVAKHAGRLAAAGAVGINLEDRNRQGAGLAALEQQIAKISAIKTQIPKLFINARCDVFLTDADDRPHTQRMTDALHRAQAYLSAGADGVFLPGLSDPDLINHACDTLTGPVNVLVKDTSQLEAMKQTGAQRISFGPNPYRAAMQHITQAAQSVYSA